MSAIDQTLPIATGDMADEQADAEALHERAETINATRVAAMSLDQALALLRDEQAFLPARRAVLMRPDIPDQALREARHAQDASIRAVAVGRRDTPPEALIEAAKDPAWSVRAEVARHQGCPRDLIIALSKDSDSVVRRSALARPENSLDVVLEVLRDGRSRLDAELVVRHPDFDVVSFVPALLEANDFGAGAVMLHDEVPAELLRRYAEVDHAPGIRLTATTKGAPPEACDRALTSDPDAKVRKAAALTGRCSAQALTQGAYDSAGSVRAAVAKDPHVPGDVVTVLLDDLDDGVRAEAAKSPNADPQALARVALHDEVDRIRIAALRNPSCDQAVVTVACNDPALVAAAVSNVNCAPEGLFQALLTLRDEPRQLPSGSPKDGPSGKRAKEVDGAIKTARRRLAPRTWQWLAGCRLEELLPDDLAALLSRHLLEAAQDPRPAIRLAVANHPQTDGPTLLLLSRDGDEHVRRAVTHRILDEAGGAL